MLPIPQTPRFGLFVFPECKIEAEGEALEVNFAAHLQAPMVGQRKRVGLFDHGVSQMCDILASHSSPASTGVAQKKDPESVISSPPAPTSATSALVRPTHLA